MSKFLRSRRGSILIEAAIAFPVLILLLLAIAEFGQALTVKRRNAQVASTAADLAAQVSSVSNCDLQDISQIGGTIFAPFSYSSTIAGLRITAVMQNANNATVQWGYAVGTLNAASQGDTFSLPSNLASANEAIIVAETSYSFKSPIGKFLTGTITFSAKAYNKPRLSSSVTLTAIANCNN